MKRMLPMHYNIDKSISLGRLLFGTEEWHIYSLDQGGLGLFTSESLYQRWIDDKIAENGMFTHFRFGKKILYYALTPPDSMIMPVDRFIGERDKNGAIAFASAIRETRKREASVPLHDAIYVEKLSRFFPTYTLTEPLSDKVILGAWLTGGVHISADSFRRMGFLTSTYTQQDLKDILTASGLTYDSKDASHNTSKDVTKTDKQKEESEDSGVEHDISTHNAPFRLPGREKLESIFNEFVIDIVRNQERYRKLGTEFPSAFVLHGPPGSGKTYAVERLVEYLDWPMFPIDCKSIGSPYIHQTGKLIASMFEEAMNSSPSVILIDEMEAFLADRSADGSAQMHHVEEVAEFLRLIPKAAKNNVLVIAMTNMIEMIDPAILRRGRFDHVIEVEMPSFKEVEALLRSELSKLPTSDDIQYDDICHELTGHPLSDVAFVIKESGRIAARNKKERIDQISISHSLELLKSSIKSTNKKLGF